MSRRRYRYNQDTKEMEEVGAEWTDAERRAATPTEELVYGKLGQATDGSPIDTKRKHREYMQKTGTTVSEDFKGTWEKAAKERESHYTGNRDTRELRESVGRALYEQRKRRG